MSPKGESLRCSYLNTLAPLHLAGLNTKELKIGAMKPTIMLTIAAPRGHQHINLDTSRCHVFWHDKRHALFEQICNDKAFAQKHRELL